MRHTLLFCLLLCACASSSPPPRVIENAYVKPNNLFDPTMESNRAALVEIEYHYFEIGSWGGCEITRSIGLVVGPNAVLDIGPANDDGGGLCGIKIRSVSGRWSGVGATKAKRLDEADDGYTDVALLITKEEISERPVVFGGMPLGEELRGYSLLAFERPYKIWEVSLGRALAVWAFPMNARVDDDGGTCYVTDPVNSEETNNYAVFDTNNRLVCIGDWSAEELEDFLFENRIPILTN